MRRKPTISTAVPGRSLCAAETLLNDPASSLAFRNQQDDPPDVRAALETAGNWYRKNWFVGMVVELKLAFFNHQFRLVDPRVKGRGEQWLKEHPWFVQYAEGVWRDRLVYDNVITVWLDQPPVNPFCAKPELCEYSDALGRERLKYRSPWRAQDLPGPLGQRWSQTVELDESRGEHFEVLKRARAGDGLGWPGLYRVFRALSQAESLEVGDALLAFVSRTVIRQHKLGHDPKSSTFKSKHPHYWTAARSAAVKSSFGNTTGFVEATTNFDHEIVFPYPDPKLFDGEKYAGPIKRLVWWGGPVAFMLMSAQANPYLMPQFLQEGLAERDRVGRYLASVLSAIGAGGLECRWSNRCFADPRTAADLMMTALSAGPLSQRTYLEASGFDADEEKERKEQEAKEDPSLHLPIYDQNHGQEPVKGSAAGSSGGRPAGKADPVG